MITSTQVGCVFHRWTNGPPLRSHWTQWLLEGIRIRIIFPGGSSSKPPFPTPSVSTMDSNWLFNMLDKKATDTTFVSNICNKYHYRMCWPLTIWLGNVYTVACERWVSFLPTYNIATWTYLHACISAYMSAIHLSIYLLLFKVDRTESRITYNFL